MGQRLLLCLLVLALAGGPAEALDGRSCGGEYPERPKTCTFILKGTPLSIFGDSIATNAHVRVSVTIDGYPEIPPLFECEASGAGYASCDGQLPDGTTVVNFPEQGAQGFVRLRCTVVGAGHGGYSCLAGGEPPP